ncbi:MAG: pseudouridine-5'-phosphate glycosidase [Anaerolineales bacterium]
MTVPTPDWLDLLPEVAAALREAKPVVALESSLITHGLPRPVNLDVARALEAEIRSRGAVPATVAVLAGRIRVGLTLEDLSQLAEDKTARKASRRDLSGTHVYGGTAGTTVAATAHVAHAAGIKTFATGGIGGVHRGPSGDISADLPALAEIPMVVVCSGAKSILDLPRTMEWLETHSIPVLGWGTNELPAFFSQSSGLPLESRVENAEQAVRWARAHWRLGLHSAVIVCVPCPEAHALPVEKVETWLREAEALANDVQGPGKTPYVLDRLSQVSGGATLAANRALLLKNASVAAALAGALGRTV